MNYSKYLKITLYSLMGLIFTLLFTFCEKKEELTYLKGTGTVTDVDGNTYKTVIIGHPFLEMGTQEWMAENLKVTRFRNGTAIPFANNSNAWNTDFQDHSPQYTWCNYDELGYGEKYGALYNIYAATDAAGLCPTGWRVPTKEDFEKLMIYFGGRGNAGWRLKSTRTVPDEHPRWNNPNTDATDEVEFNALPAGFIGGGGQQVFIGEMAWWWSTSSYDADQTRAYAFHANYNDAIIGYSPQPKIEGRAIRCVKEE